MDSPPMFNSVEDECRYWKERAKLYHKEWTDVKQEYDEYVEQSRQMEAEMDATLDQKQNIIKDLRTKNSNLEKENESLKLKHDSLAIEFANIEKQLEKIKNERDSEKEYMRQLEQKNDDLERAHRILNESIVDFERMLDKAYEKNALLEMEVDEKEILQEKLQRLMDETRDLKQELNVKSRYAPNGSVNNSLTTSTTIPNGIVKLENNGDISNTIQNSSTTTTSMTNINDFNQRSMKNPDNLLNGNAMQASSRTTALNIVADMLRKLNLDKALLCSQCDKFRCICERPAASTEQNVCNSATNDDSRISRSFSSCVGGNNSSTPTHTDDSLRTSTNHAVPPSLRSNSGSSNSLNFGTNMFKRFAQRMSGNVDLFTSTLNTTKTTTTTTKTSSVEGNKTDL